MLERRIPHACPPNGATVEGASSGVEWQRNMKGHCVGRGDFEMAAWTPSASAKVSILIALQYVRDERRKRAGRAATDPLAP